VCRCLAAEFGPLSSFSGVAEARELPPQPEVLGGARRLRDDLQATGIRSNAVTAATSWQ